MNKKSLVLVVTAAIIMLGGGVTYAFIKHGSDQKVADEHAAMMKQDETAAKMHHDEAMAKEEAMKKDSPAMKAGSDTMVKGSFSDYDSTKLVNAEKGKVVLFFSAAWCPICQEANKNYNASSTPNGLTLLKVDYDNSTDLKKKYGVTYQHTYVQVDGGGNQIKKWSGSTTYDQIEAELNKA